MSLDNFIENYLLRIPEGDFNSLGEALRDYKLKNTEEVWLLLLQLEGLYDKRYEAELGSLLHSEGWIDEEMPLDTDEVHAYLEGVIKVLKGKPEGCRPQGIVNCKPLSQL